MVFLLVNFWFSGLCQLTHFEWFTKQISEASRSNPEGISEASAMQPGQKRHSRGRWGFRKL